MLVLTFVSVNFIGIPEKGAECIGREVSVLYARANCISRSSLSLMFGRPWLEQQFHVLVLVSSPVGVRTTLTAPPQGSVLVFATSATKVQHSSLLGETGSNFRDG